MMPCVRYSKIRCGSTGIRVSELVVSLPIWYCCEENMNVVAMIQSRSLHLFKTLFTSINIFTLVACWLVTEIRYFSCLVVREAGQSCSPNEASQFPNLIDYVSRYLYLLMLHIEHYIASPTSVIGLRDKCIPVFLNT